MVYIDNLILGAGIAGLATGQKLRENAEEFLIVEKETQYGGLCTSFNVGDFIFDYFIHMSFTTNNFIRKYFDNTPHYCHMPNPFNYYHGTWIKHPAINNLYPLKTSEKQQILKGLRNRGKYENRYTENYANWLKYQFGDYFAENFPFAYTRKYWAEDAENMETKWIGNRVYQPTLDEILVGMETDDTPITYYAKEMRFPKQGGFSEFLKNFVYIERIHCNEIVRKVNPKEHIVITDKEKYCYKRLYSSIPLPELANILSDTISELDKFKMAVSKLHWTGGYIISLGMKGKLKRTELWNYVYDEDIIISRFYSPSLMSSATVPEGCCSLQAEVYTRDGMPYEYSEEKLLEIVIEQLSYMDVIDKEKIIVKDIRFIKYCNILFDHNIYENREIALDILEKNEIVSIGRFGRWDYFWSDQAFKNGYDAVVARDN